MEEKLNPVDFMSAMMNAGAHAGDEVEIRGHYNLECHDADGNTLWTDSIENIVVTVGKTQLLTNGTSTTTFMSLFSGASAPTLAVGDTMATHTAAAEASSTNVPSYGTSRPTVTWNAANTGTITTGTSSFVFTGTGGTIQSGFLVFGTGALTTVLNTGGVLLSEGNLTTPQPVVAGNTLTMSYTLSM